MLGHQDWRDSVSYRYRGLGTESDEEAIQCLVINKTLDD